MNDTDTQDARIQQLVNAAVDRELAGSRIAPPWNPARLPERRPATHPVTRWSVPVLAASVAALLAAGTVVAIGHDRDRRATPAAHSASPTPSPSVSVSVSVSTNPNLQAANRAYAEAVVTAMEPTEANGVSVGPLSAKDAARLKDTGLISGDISGITAPEPGKVYSFTLSYLAGPSDKPPAVLTTGVQDVASGSCAAQPFLARPGHSYQIQCHAMLMDGVIGKATLTLRTPTGTMAGSMNLTDPARAYADAVANAPEASKVAGISERPASAEELRRGGGTVGILESAPLVPDPGRSYPVTLLYVPAPDAPSITVLAIRLEDVPAGHCPRAFRARPAHAYIIHCQVTFQADTHGMAYYAETGPHGVQVPAGISLGAP